MNMRFFALGALVVGLGSLYAQVPDAVGKPTLQERAIEIAKAKIAQVWDEVVKGKALDAIAYERYQELRPLARFLPDKYTILGTEIDLAPIKETIMTGRITPAMAKMAKDAARKWLIETEINIPLVGKTAVWDVAKLGAPIFMDTFEKIDKEMYPIILPKLTLPEKVKAFMDNVHQLGIDSHPIIRVVVDTFRAKMYDMIRDTIQEILDKKVEELAAIDTGQRATKVIEGIQAIIQAVQDKKLLILTPALQNKLIALGNEALAIKDDVMSINFKQVFDDLKDKVDWKKVAAPLTDEIIKNMASMA